VKKFRGYFLIDGDEFRTYFMLHLNLSILTVWGVVATSVYAQSGRVVDISTRAGVSQRFLFSAPSNTKVAVILWPAGVRAANLPEQKIRWM
jgi:hypothetical protein